MMRTWSRREILVSGIGCLLAACSHGQVGSVGYSVATSGEGNQVAIAHDQAVDAYIATVHSERGIGQASIAWWGSEAPHHVIFEVYLSGLEDFSLHWADQAVNVSVNSIDQTVIQSARIGKSPETAITAGSPYWMEVTLPTAGVFQLQAPQAFIAAAPKLWGIAWVDFYR